MAATVLDASGAGTFVPLSFLFFVLTTEPAAAQVGFGSSLAILLFVQGGRDGLIAGGVRGRILCGGVPWGGGAAA